MSAGYGLSISKTMDLDTVIIGAGAAGIGAGLRLREAKRRFVILEARPRIGGRTYTEVSRFGVPVDHGGQWCHSAETNPLVPIARAAGFHLRERSEDWGANNAKPFLDAGDVAELRRWFAAFFTAIDTFDWRGPDQPVAALLTNTRWRALTHAVMTHICGAAPDRVSTADLAADQSGDIDLPIREGMGALIAHLARDLPVRTATPVTAIDWSQKGVRVTTSTGTLRCEQIVITVPTNVLASGSITFTPPLPEAKQTALAQLPMGSCEKVFVPLRGAPLSEDEHVFYFSSVSSEDACHLLVHPFGRPYATGYFGDRAAREIADMGNAGASDAVRSALVGVFGSAAASSVGDGNVTQWGRDPFSQGAYSYVEPGNRGAREVLAQPLAERLFFTGEATYAAHYASVHGAFLSGQNCAAEILRADPATMASHREHNGQ